MVSEVFPEIDQDLLGWEYRAGRASPRARWQRCSSAARSPDRDRLPVTGHRPSGIGAPGPRRIELAATAVLLALEPTGERAAPEDWPILSDPERAAAQAIQDRLRRAEFIRSRSLLRRLAGSALDLPPTQVPLRHEPSGRPYLSGHDAGVSLSHTEGLTAAALCPDGPVGVDVQSHPASIDDRLLRRCCGPWAEQIAGLPPAARAAKFAHVWSVQEACVKAVGQGIFAEPWHIPVHPDAHRGRWHGRWGEVAWRALPDAAPAAWAVAVAVAVEVAATRSG